MNRERGEDKKEIDKDRKEKKRYRPIEREKTRGRQREKGKYDDSE